MIPGGTKKRGAVRRSDTAPSISPRGPGWMERERYKGKGGWLCALWPKQAPRKLTAINSSHGNGLSANGDPYA